MRSRLQTPLSRRIEPRVRPYGSPPIQPPGPPLFEFVIKTWVDKSWMQRTRDSYGNGRTSKREALDAMESKVYASTYAEAVNKVLAALPALPADFKGQSWDDVNDLIHTRKTEMVSMTEVR